MDKDFKELSFIESVANAILIKECVELIDFLYKETSIKCVNLSLPKQDEYNRDIITREMKNTQDYIFDFIVSCNYQLEKETIKELKKYARKIKFKSTQDLYTFLGIEYGG